MVGTRNSSVGPEISDAELNIWKKNLFNNSHIYSWFYTQTSIWICCDLITNLTVTHPRFDFETRLRICAYII